MDREKHVTFAALIDRRNDSVGELHKLNLRDLRRRFDRAAASFDSADFVHAVTREGLLDRMVPLVVDAKVVVDLGSATGSAGASLRKRFRGAHIVSVDISRPMLEKSRQKRARFSFARSSFVQANACSLPFREQSVDVVFSNLLLPFVDPPERMFEEVARILRKGGVFAFATLGPDSLLELRRAWRGIDDHAHVKDFLDMHDVGDALLKAGLRDPVLDVDRLRVQYATSGKLFADLERVGARNTLRQRCPALTGRRRFGRMIEALSQGNAAGSIELELELVYGHCWGGGPRMQPGNFRIDASGIPRRRRQDHAGSDFVTFSPGPSR